MPARLKSFELHGYKTFATRSEFIFSDGITAIVGPNGSGKSNIADALRWVLGEQSYGLLRAKKTEDMIFAGSENRPRAGMASATVVFDNTDGWLPIDYTEVGITRRAYRDGDNEYLLNNQRVRLKDVSEVLAKSGLAERTYTIIGQGLVDAALALKAEERRRLFEEAAGIGLHRSRREEALKRLEMTGRNLERVQDILAELQPRLRSLERQAKRAQEYDQMKANLKVALREWYGYHWHQAQTELVSAQVTAKQHEAIFSKVQADQLNLDQRLSEYRTKINEQRASLNQYHNELSGMHQQREAISREQAVNAERSRLLRIQIEQLSVEKNKADEEASIQQDQLQAIEQELAQLEQELHQASESAAVADSSLKDRQTARAAIEEHIKALQNEHMNTRAHTTQLESRRAEKSAYCERLRTNLQNSEKDISSAKAALKTANEREDAFRDTIKEKVKISQAIQQELSQLQAKSVSLETAQREVNEHITQKKTLIAQVQAEIQVLEEAEKNYTGYEEGARILLQAMNEKRLNGAIGSLGISLSVPQEYEVAIAAILGEYIDSLVIESISQSDSALDLIESDTIRGSIFPLDSISQIKPLSLDLQTVPVNPDNIIGIAADLIQSEPVLKPIVDLLFGQVIIVKDRSTARKILSSSDLATLPNLKVVTVSGEMYLSTGPIIRGASRKGLLVRPRHHREEKATLENEVKSADELKQRYAAIQIELNQQQQAVNEAKDRYQQAEGEEKSLNSQFNQLELQAEKLQRDLQWQQDQKSKIEFDLANEINEVEKIKSEINGLQADSKHIQLNIENAEKELSALPVEELQDQFSYWNTNRAVIERALQDTKNRREEKVSQYQQLEISTADLVRRLTALDLEINTLNENIGVRSKEELVIAEKIEKLSMTVAPIEDQLRTLESEYNSLLTTDAFKRQQLRAAEQQYSQAKITLARLTESFENLRSHIEDDFGLVAFDYTESVSGPKPLPLSGLVEELPKVATLSPEIEESIRQQKALIRRMGAINPEAQNEYREVKDRYDFLTSQVEDLTKAEGDIRDVITELDALMEREFRRTFEAVAQEFKQIFTRLFGGGSARLALTDPENLTDTGIDIEARLPGRREQGLALLSGGERSLTATALVFALLRVSPTPFCILDEVDAMLDEANVGRFRDLLTELSEKTQFIVITHNRNTVQAASIIYGVTMGRDSTSQVISLRMDELGEEFGV